MTNKDLTVPAVNKRDHGVNGLFIQLHYHTVKYAIGHEDTKRDDKVNTVNNRPLQTSSNYTNSNGHGRRSYNRRPTLHATSVINSMSFGHFKRHTIQGRNIRPTNKVRMTIQFMTKRRMRGRRNNTRGRCTDGTYSNFP